MHDRPCKSRIAGTATVVRGQAPVRSSVDTAETVQRGVLSTPSGRTGDLARLEKEPGDIESAIRSSRSQLVGMLFGESLTRRG